MREGGREGKVMRGKRSPNFKWEVLNSVQVCKVLALTKQQQHRLHVHENWIRTIARTKKLNTRKAAKSIYSNKRPRLAGV